MATVAEVAGLAQRHIARGDFERGLRLIHDFVEWIVTEPVCAARVEGSPVLDGLCALIGEKVFSAAGLPRMALEADSGRSPLVVHVVTKVQRSGGHSRVVADFIRSMPGASHVVLSTEGAGRSDKDFVSGVIAGQLGASFEAAPRGGLEKKLRWLQRRLLELRPARAYLFNHHQDSVAAAALQPSMGIEGWFYHHGDHHLSLGVHLPHLRHIDPHPMGFHACRRAGVPDAVYLPLTVDDRGPPPADREWRSSAGLVTCTAARSNKVEVPYFVRYADVVPELLAATGGTHVHIGTLSRSARTRIAAGLGRHGVAAERFVYVPWVPSVWEALQSHGVDLYVASFPYGGGLTLIEAMGSGTPVALHNHVHSRVLSGIDLAYPEAFVWTEPQQLIAHCRDVSAASLAREAARSRSWYETYHRREVLEGLLAPGAAPLPPPEHLSGRFQPRNDEWAAWVAGQFTVGGLLRRGLYRAGRRLRARLSS